MLTSGLPGNSWKYFILYCWFVQICVQTRSVHCIWLECLITVFKPLDFISVTFFIPVYLLKKKLFLSVFDKKFICLFIKAWVLLIASLRYHSACSSVPCVCYELEIRSWFSLIQVQIFWRDFFLVGFMYVPLFRLLFLRRWQPLALMICSPDLEFAKWWCFHFYVTIFIYWLKYFLERNFIEKPRVINCFVTLRYSLCRKKGLNAWFFPLIYLFSNQVAFQVVFRGVQWVSCE